MDTILKKKDKTKYSIYNNVSFLLKDMAKIHPLLIFFLLLEAGLAVLSPILGIYLPKIAIDLVVSGSDVVDIFYTLGGFTLLMSLVLALSIMAKYGKYFLYNDMRMYYMKELFLKSLECGYNQIESPIGQIKYRRAFDALNKGDFSGTSRITVAMVDIFVAVVSFVLYSGIISTLNLYVVLFLIVLSCINIFAVKNAQKYEYKNKD